MKKIWYLWHRGARGWKDYAIFTKTLINMSTKERKRDPTMS